MCAVKAKHPVWLGIQDQDVLNEPMNYQQQQWGYVQTQNPALRGPFPEAHIPPHWNLQITLVATPQKM